VSSGHGAGSALRKGSFVDVFSGAKGEKLFRLPDAWDKLDAPTKR
jgi:hypothetical protein